MHPDIEIFLLFWCFSISAANLFIYCFFGKLASESYAKMSDSLFETNWQSLPIDLQKYVVIMIGNGQRPLHYHGFGVAVLNLEIFCKVNHEFHSKSHIFQKKIIITI